MADGDGCSAGCLQETGFVCTGAPSVCTTTCGDGVAGGLEQCDDGETIDGDGCNAVCIYEHLQEVEPNDTSTLARNHPALIPGYIYDAALVTNNEYDTFVLDITSPLDVRIQLFGPEGYGTCAGGLDMYVEILDSTGLRQAFDHDGGPGDCPDLNPDTNGLAAQVQPGRYYVRIRAQRQQTTVPAYQFLVTFLTTCGDGVMEGGEECEGESTLCSGCRIIPVCGNSTVERSEQCDDGNLLPDDGCNGSCQTVSSHRCAAGSPSVCTPVEYVCSDGLDNDADGSTDAADSDCALANSVTPCAVGQEQIVLTGRDTPLALALTGGSQARLVAPSGLGLVQRVAVRVGISHMVPSELTVGLTAPNGATTNLVNRSGLMGLGYVQTIFDDACTTPITSGASPYTGCFHPEGSMDNLASAAATGIWTLPMNDVTGPNPGTLAGWALMLCTDP